MKEVDTSQQQIDDQLDFLIYQLYLYGSLPVASKSGLNSIAQDCRCHQQSKYLAAITSSNAISGSITNSGILVVD
jgi:hypothetical protein